MPAATKKKAAPKAAAAEKLEPGTSLISLETLKPQEVFVPNGTDSLMAIVEGEMEKFRAANHDVNTEAGRKAIGRMDRLLASSKVGVDELRKDFTLELRNKVDAINAEGNRFKARMEELQDEVSKPLEAWKQKEKDRVEALNRRIEAIKLLDSQTVPNESAASLEQRLTSLEGLTGRDTGLDWQDFKELATETYDAVKASLMNKLTHARVFEAQQAEIQKLRDAEALRNKEAEDERLRKEGEEKAKQQQQEQTAAAERNRILGHQNRMRQLSGLVEGLADAGSAVIKERCQTAVLTFQGPAGAPYDWQEFRPEATRIYNGVSETLTTVLPATEKREQEAADKLKKDAEDAATLREQNRQAEEKRQADEKEKALAADKEHRGKINKAALAAIRGACENHALAKPITEEQGIAILTAIVKGQVPQVAITYTVKP